MLELKENPEQTKRLAQCLQYLREHRAGVRFAGSARKKSILALLEHGAPGRNIPPRPLVAPALEKPEAREAVGAALLGAAAAAARGDRAGTEAGLRAAGEAAADAVRAAIDAGVPPPNAPATAARKGFNQPYYDTGELYDSFVGEVTKK